MAEGKIHIWSEVESYKNANYYWFDDPKTKIAFGISDYTNRLVLRDENGNSHFFQLTPIS